jgi:hypothetical protein
MLLGPQTRQQLSEESRWHFDSCALKPGYDQRLSMGGG